MEPNFVSTTVVATALGISRATVCLYIRQKKIPTVRLGGKNLIPATWLQQQMKLVGEEE
jgi:excisionase family DNA binding protein